VLQWLGKPTLARTENGADKLEHISGGVKTPEGGGNQVADVVREHPRGVLWNTGGMYQVELYVQVRRSVYVEGLSEREAVRRFGIARETVRKMLRYAPKEPKGTGTLITFAFPHH
jgi:hypothetical protein